ncbi:hypothetical protein [Phenylobacterium sp.]|uniref:hypothetical protein n=1 Tax=Phenylobacterium sp. TaxID=1871053 RepID=UPI0035623D16
MTHTFRSYRSLDGLHRTASTSRVLNLAAVADEYQSDALYFSAPFFESTALNTAVIVKHRLRPDEVGLLEWDRRSATKVIIPFERRDLALGGRSLFVGQRGWLTLLEELRGGQPGGERDKAVLEALDELPSLDPFLLREHLRRRKFRIAECYFAFSRPDTERMQHFVSHEISKLVDLAYDRDGEGGSSISKLVAALLSGEDSDRLEPLRLTLGRESIFSWKGFLYYKWVLATLLPELSDLLAELNRIEVGGSRDQHKLSRIHDWQRRVNQAIGVQVKRVRQALEVYDEAFEELTNAGRPKAFRDFLLHAPEMFLSLGERAGILSHIASFWRFRFPAGAPLKIDLDELIDILTDFYDGLGTEDDVATIARPQIRLAR